MIQDAKCSFKIVYTAKGDKYFFNPPPPPLPTHLFVLISFCRNVYTTKGDNVWDSPPPTRYSVQVLKYRTEYKHIRRVIQKVKCLVLNLNIVVMYVQYIQSSNVRLTYCQIYLRISKMLTNNTGPLVTT